MICVYKTHFFEEVYKMKRLIKSSFALALALTMIFSITPLASFVGIDFREFNLLGTKAKAETYSSDCGDNLTWTLDTETGVLSISGTGAFSNYSSSSNAPWYSYRSSIKTIKIGNGVTSIGDYAFYNCTSLNSVTIPDSVTSIGDYAFYYCYNQKSITIPDSVKNIGDYAFYYSSLTSITIPDSVKNIGDYAFFDCDDLTSITIGNGVTSIGAYAFNNCNSLKSITVDSANTTYSSDEYGVLYNKDKTELIKYPARNTINTYTIPNSVTSIVECAFQPCQSLTSITIPDSVTSIGDYAFNNCNSLKSITVDSANTTYSSDEYGVLFNKDKTELIQFPTRNTRNRYTIPDSVLNIRHSAFQDCSILTSITIPNSVLSIEYSAFQSCDRLVSVTIPDSVSYIGEKAFSDCYNLQSVTISDSA